jgi:hypothetical protein
VSSTATALKAVKGGKTDDDPSVRHITLRGVEYTIREIDVVEYDEMIEGLADENGAVRFDKLLRAMVLKCVTPLGSKPLKFPVFRTLEDIVNKMHYTDVEPDGEDKGDDESEEDADESEEDGKTTAPNS